MINGKVFFEKSDFGHLNDFIKKSNYSSIFVLVDTNTYEFCLPLLMEKVSGLKQINILEIEPGEQSKDLEIVAGLWQTLLENFADRNALLINLGGGVVTDLGGLIASTFKRGIDYVNIPTSLLGMVDASIGGKNGINFGGIKNSIGLFNSPEGTFIATPFLASLPEQELKVGWAEAIKHALVSDSAFFKVIENVDPGNVDEIALFVEKAAQLKMQIVANDFKEKGERKKLNFGHTVGHALEALFMDSENPISHGEAITLGMICESYLSNLKLGLDFENMTRIVTYLKTVFAPQKINKKDFEFLLNQMKNDKKSKGEMYQFALLNAIGSCKVDVMCTEEEVLESFGYLNSL